MVVIIRGLRVYLPIRFRIPDKLTTLAVDDEIGTLTDTDAEYEVFTFYGVGENGETLVFRAPKLTT